MKIKILTSLLVGFITLQSFAGGIPMYNTTWTPSNLFIDASNGSIVTGTITVNSNNTANPFGSPSRPFSVNYTTPQNTSIVLNNSGFFHNINAFNSNVTSIIGYTINLTNSTFVGTVAGNINIQSDNNGSFNGNLPFTLITKNQRPFVTEWDLSSSNPFVAPSSAISFGVGTSGTASYAWETIPASSSGVGTFSGSTLSIINLPVGSRISLSINGTNFHQFRMALGASRILLRKVTQWGTTNWSSMERAFHGCASLQITAIDIPNLSSVTNMNQMFRGCEVLNSPSNVGMWNTSSVTNMSNLFDNAWQFNQSIGGWNTSSVTDMGSMFLNAYAFNQPIDNWNTSNVISMTAMFSNATSFNQPIGNWNTSNVIYLNEMFYSAEAFNQPIGGWNVNKVKNMNSMFAIAKSFNQSIGGWNVGLVDDMSSMFTSAESFNQPIGTWNVGKVEYMYEMFTEAKSFNQPLADWNISTCVEFTSMFKNATAFNQSLGAWGVKFIPTPDLSNMLDNSGLSPANYDATLQGFAAGSVTGRSFSAIDVKYCTAGNARNTLVTDKNWTIVDAGTATGTSIVTQPVSQTVCGGTMAPFTVSATGTGTLTYAWSNGMSTTTSMITLTAGTNYMVTVSGTCGSVVSNTFSNTVNAVTAIATQPMSQIIQPNATASLSVSAAGVNLTYKWSSNETVSGISGKSAGVYTVTVSGTCGSVVSNAATIVGLAISSATVSGISANGSLTSATSITISGTGFVNGATITVNGVSISNFTVVNSTSIIATIPAGTLLASNNVVLVQNPNQVASANSPVVITVVSLPTNLPTYQSTSFSVYPNPVVNGEWRMENGEVGATMYVFNAQGTIVYTQSITSTTTEVSAKLSSGIYLVKVGKQMVKLVVE
ncbi:MAG: BspA family leucine-rich repeat surface protein [Bacteroidetes bacterium]|nr:MAG: BspA family leucine-rich repeat surface protein [Bacteroidota bacterium]